MNIMRFSGPYLQCSATTVSLRVYAQRVESIKCNERAACIWKLCALTNNVIYMNMDLVYLFTGMVLAYNDLKLIRSV